MAMESKRRSLSFQLLKTEPTQLYRILPTKCDSRGAADISGFSLIEVVASIILFGVVSGILFEIFFSNLGIENDIEITNRAERIAQDLKSFIKISKYDFIYQLANGRNLLSVSEISSGEIIENKFSICDTGEISKNLSGYICKMSLINDPITNTHYEIGSCYFAVLCDIFYAGDFAKNGMNLRNSSLKDFDNLNPRFSFVTVKNR